MTRSSFETALSLTLTATLVLGACGGDGSEPTPPNTDPGAISGTVREAGASGLAGVTVALSGAATGTTTTSATGGYQFQNLSAGQYTVSVTAPAGFEAPTAKSVTVSAGATATVDFELQAEEEGVEVIDLSGTSFSRPQLTIPAGTTVRWVNKDGVFHTVTPDGHSEWSSASLNQQGQTFEHTFNSAGSFPYYCQPHKSAGMTGTITVQ